MKSQELFYNRNISVINEESVGRCGNMKKRIFIITILSMAILTACNESGKTNDTPKNGQDKKQAEKLEINTKKNYSKEEEVKEEKGTQGTDKINESDEKKESESEVKKEVTISVFYSNDDATAFTADMVKIKELTPENVLNALADKGVIDNGIKINKFEVSEVDGMQSIDIDFDQKFKEYITSCGSTQEYYVIGGICNTFIKAYQADRIKITVDGNCLETGHNDYPEYMFEF